MTDSVEASTNFHPASMIAILSRCVDARPARRFLAARPRSLTHWLVGLGAEADIKLPAIGAIYFFEVVEGHGVGPCRVRRGWMESRRVVRRLRLVCTRDVLVPLDGLSDVRAGFVDFVK